MFGVKLATDLSEWIPRTLSLLYSPRERLPSLINSNAVGSAPATAHALSREKHNTPRNQFVLLTLSFIITASYQIADNLQLLIELPE
jgi:hypothetical protein